MPAFASLSHWRVDLDYPTSATTSITHGPGCHYLWSDSDEGAATALANVIGDYVSPSIVAVGLLGNAASLAVMLQPKQRSTSFAVYLAALAICDTGGLVTWLVRSIVMTYWRVGLDDLGCKLDIGFKYSFRMIGYMLVACLTADRYVAVRRPMDALRWCRARRAAYTCLLLSLVSFVLASPAFVLGKRNPGKPYACALYSTQSDLVAAYMFLVPLGCNLVTFCFVMAANAAIVWSIRRRLKYRGVCERHLAMGFTRRPMSDTNSGDSTDPSGSSRRTKVKDRSKVTFTVQRVDSRGQRFRTRTESFACTECSRSVLPLSKRDRNLINILMLVTVAFLLLNSPQLIRVSVSYIYHMDHSCEQRAAQYLMFQITNNLANINYSINFFLYCLSGPRFRRDLIRVAKAVKKVTIGIFVTSFQRCRNIADRSTHPTE